MQSLSKAVPVKAAWAKAVLALWMAMMVPHTAGAQAKSPISIELVIAVDTSLSVDSSEHEFLMQGIATAFRAPEVIDLIGLQNGVAVTLFQWSSEANAQYMIPWHLLKDPSSILSFADKVGNAKRNPDRVFTGIGEAIDFGVRLIAENAYEGRQLKIDISGDGRNNTGLTLAIARQNANALGVVINGLPILTNTAAKSVDLDKYYRENVIHGPGAFVEIADDYDDFARAFKRKLLRELSPQISQNTDDPRLLVQEARADPTKIN